MIEYKNYFLILFFYVTSLFTQEIYHEQVPAEVYINALARDGDYLWIGSSAGIVKLNVKTGEKVYFNTNNSPIPFNSVSSIAIDKNGGKWFVFKDYFREYSFIALFDDKKWTFFDRETLEPIHLSADSSYRCLTYEYGWKEEVFKIEYISFLKYSNFFYHNYDGDTLTNVTSDVNGNIWFASSRGIIKYDGQKMVVFNHENSCLKLNFKDITYIASDDKGNIWFSTKKGVYKFNEKTCSFYNFPDTLTVGKVFLVDKKGNAWFGSENGILKFDSKNWTFIRDTNFTLRSINYIPLALDIDHNLWVGSSKVIYSFKLYVEKEEKVLLSFSLQEALFFYKMLLYTIDEYPSLLIYVDKEGNKWVAYGCFLYKFDGKVLNEIDIFRKVSSMQTENINNFDFSDYIWITKEEGALLIYDGKNWIEWPLIYSSSINDLAVDKNEKCIWLVDYCCVRKYDGNNIVTYHMKKDEVKQILIDSDNNKWFLTAKSLVKFNGQTWEFYDVTMTGPTIEEFNCMVMDKSGHIWVGTNKGPIKFNGQNFIYYYSRSSNFPECKIISMAVDRDGNLWCSTNTCKLYKLEGRYWTEYNLENYGFSCYAIFKILFDKYNNLWFLPVVTTSCIVGDCVIYYETPAIGKFDGKTLKVYLGPKVYSRTYDGYDYNEDYFINDFQFDPNGNLWLRTSEGLFRFKEK